MADHMAGRAGARRDRRAVRLDRGDRHRRAARRTATDRDAARRREPAQRRDGADDLQIAVAAAVGGALSSTGALTTFASAGLGGWAIGLAVGWVDRADPVADRGHAGGDHDLPPHAVRRLPPRRAARRLRRDRGGGRRPVPRPTRLPHHGRRRPADGACRLGDHHLSPQRVRLHPHRARGAAAPALAHALGRDPARRHRRRGRPGPGRCPGVVDLRHRLCAAAPAREPRTPHLFAHRSSCPGPACAASSRSPSRSRFRSPSRTAGRSPRARHSSS